MKPTQWPSGFLLRLRRAAASVRHRFAHQRRPTQEQANHDTDSRVSRFGAMDPDGVGENGISRLQAQAAAELEEAEGGRPEYLPTLVDRDVPISAPKFAGKRLLWLFDSDREGYFRRGGHPIYGEKDIVYRFNSNGYRCPEFNVDADIRIVAVGCSYVLGQELPQRALFHEVFAQRLREDSGKSVVLWNLGQCGASNDFIIRHLYLCIPALDPHIVLVNFTHLGRREYVSVQNRAVNYNPHFTPIDSILRDIYSHFAALSSPFDDHLNFFKNYKAVQYLLSDRVWMCSHINSKEFDPVKAQIDPSRFAGALQIVDRARDGGHPGPNSNRGLAELYWRRFKALCPNGVPTRP